MSYDPDRGTENGFTCPVCKKSLHVYSIHHPAPGIRHRYKKCANPQCKSFGRSHARTEERVRPRSP